MKCPICGLDVEDLEIHRKIAHGEWMGIYQYETSLKDKWKEKIKEIEAVIDGKKVKIVTKKGIGYVEG